MMRTLKYTALLAAAALAVAALFAACSTDPTGEAGEGGETPLPPQSDMPICWDVKDVASQSDTRNLIGNSLTSTNPADPNYLLPLKYACRTDLATDPLKERGFAVGLFGDYYYVENADTDKPDTVRVYDLYRGARLVYLEDVVTNDKVLSQWDTNVAMRYWHPGAHYIFRAYYPQRLHNYTISNSNATTMAMVYPSRKLQYDLLLGYAPVEATNEQMKNAVELELSHALSALRFQFRLNFEDGDFLTSVYLLNDEEKHFFTQGTVTYGSKKDLGSMVWLQDYNPPADEVLYKWVPPLKYWYGKDKNNNDKIDIGEDLDGDGVIEPDETEELSTEDMLKYWGVAADGTLSELSKTNPVLMVTVKDKNSSDAGDVTPSVSTRTVPGGVNTIKLITKKTSYAYYGMEDHYDEPSKQWVYNSPDDVAVEGKLYCRNSSWLLIPPQESFGKLTLCFTTKRGDQAVYKVALPQKTGTMIGKDGKVMKDADGKFITESTEGKDAWVAGVRYTYLVTLSETHLGVDVSIEPWNERKHSTEIIF